MERKRLTTSQRKRIDDQLDSLDTPTRVTNLRLEPHARFEEHHNIVGDLSVDGHKPFGRILCVGSSEERAKALLEDYEGVGEADRFYHIPDIPGRGERSVLKIIDDDGIRRNVDGLIIGSVEENPAKTGDTR